MGKFSTKMGEIIEIFLFASFSGVHGTPKGIWKYAGECEPCHQDLTLTMPIHLPNGNQADQLDYLIGWQMPQDAITEIRGPREIPHFIQVFEQLKANAGIGVFTHDYMSNFIHFYTQRNLFIGANHPNESSQERIVFFKLYACNDMKIKKVASVVQLLLNNNIKLGVGQQFSNRLNLDLTQIQNNSDITRIQGVVRNTNQYLSMIKDMVTCLPDDTKVIVGHIAKDQSIAIVSSHISSIVIQIITTPPTEGEAQIISALQSQYDKELSSNIRIDTIERPKSSITLEPSCKNKDGEQVEVAAKTSRRRRRKNKASTHHLSSSHNEDIISKQHDSNDEEYYSCSETMEEEIAVIKNKAQLPSLPSSSDSKSSIRW